jgi:hypothetical protein
MRDFARLTLCYDEIFARHGSPGDIGRARASPAIDAMTIDQSKRPTLQRVSRPAANASTSELHKIRLAHSNHESTLLCKATARQARMNTNYRCSGGRVGCALPVDVSRLPPVPLLIVTSFRSRFFAPVSRNADHRADRRTMDRP